ncbi:hypothetical protein EDB85DRAFT_1892598 [Lactarius pseudohatsudake]|nr:hypothetical protein EDB85DRAFT_1892598 [Lactarius pseudohatsudake]
MYCRSPFYYFPGGCSPTLTSTSATLPATSPSSTPGLMLQTDLAVDVLTVILRAYLAETSMDHLAGALKKGGIKDCTDSVLDAHFRSQVVDWWTRKQNTVIKEDIAKAIKESLEHEHEHERRYIHRYGIVNSPGHLGESWVFVLCARMLVLEPSVDPAYIQTPLGLLSPMAQRQKTNKKNYSTDSVILSYPSWQSLVPRRELRVTKSVGHELKATRELTSTSPRPGSQGGVVEKKRKREVRSRDATASRGNIGTNAKSKGRNNEPSHRVNQTLFLVSWNGSEETHEITPDIYASSGGPSSVGVIGNGEYRRLPQWAAGPAKLNYDPATLAQVPKASKRSSPLRNWRDGLWSSEGDGGGEGNSLDVARLPVRGGIAEREKLEKEGCKNLVLRSGHIGTNARSKRSSEPTHKVNQTEGSEGVEERPYDKRRVEEEEQANPHRVNRTCVEAWNAESLSVIWGTGKVCNDFLRHYYFYFALELRVVEAATNQGVSTIWVSLGLLFRKLLESLNNEVSFR